MASPAVQSTPRDVHHPDMAWRRAVDASCRVPVLAFFCTAVFWLLIGSALAIGASIKMHDPPFLATHPWLTFGRVRPAHMNSVVYGWASLAGIGVLLWLTCRLCRVPLRWPGAMLGACGVWNAGVAWGAAAILAGQGTSIEWLDFPAGPSFCLFAAFAIITLWMAAAFADRAPGHVYVSQWYLFGSVFWFPLIYATAQILLLLHPVRGVVQESANWWYAHNILGIWFTPIGLAAIYYLIPKVLGRPIHSYYLSILGFWTLALFYNWNGAHHFIGGPIPAWITTVSIVASVMMIIPVTTVAMNHHLTMKGRFGLLRYSPTLRFIVFGAMAYTLVSVQGSTMALRAINEPLHFTQHTIAHAHLGLYGFFTMTMFGSMYYIVPRLTGREWASARLIRVHFWCDAIGIVAYVGALTIGGALQGLELNNASESYLKLIHENGVIRGFAAFFKGLHSQGGGVPFLDIVRDLVPWLFIRTLAGTLMTVGHLAFALLLAMNVLAIGRRRAGPTLFRHDRAAYEASLAAVSDSRAFAADVLVREKELP